MLRLRNRLLEDFLLVILTVVISYGLFGARQTNAGGAPGTSALDQILARKTLRFGIPVAGLPVATRDQQGKIVGWVPDIGEEMAKALAVKLEIVDTAAPSRIPFLVAGKIDVSIGTVTLERAKAVSFSNIWAVDGTAAVVLGWWLVRQVYLPSAANRRGYSRIRAVWEGLYGRASRWGPPPWVLIALTWAVVLLLVNWYPYDFTTDPVRFQNSDPELSDENTPVVGLRRMSWAPLVDYYWGSRYQALDQFVRRVVSFAPLGILLSAAWGRREPWGSAAMLLATLLLAALIETGQYFIPARHPSVTDLLLEVFGAWLGYQGARHVASALRPACTSALTV